MKTIPLTKGHETEVDDEDYEFLNQWQWTADVRSDGRAYARRQERVNGQRKTFTMHRMILKLPEKFGGVDHKDRNSLNNQKSNLRMANDHQNGANRDANKNNTSGFKGVTWSKAARKWQAQIMVNRKPNYLGLFEDPKSAARRYDQEAIKLFEEFAASNKQLGRLNG